MQNKPLTFQRTVIKPQVILVIATIVQLCQLKIRIPIRGLDLMAAQNWDISLNPSKIVTHYAI